MDEYAGDFGYLEHLENGGVEPEDLHAIMDSWLESGAITQDEYDANIEFY